MWARRHFKSRLGSKAGLPVAIGAVVAGMFDIVEYLSMLGYPNGWGDWSGWIPLATAMAIPKFLLVVISVAYILIGIGIWAFGSLADRRRLR